MQRDTPVLDPMISYERACEDHTDNPHLLAYLEATKATLNAYYIQYYSNHVNTSYESVTNTAWSMSSDGSPSKVNLMLRYKKKDNLLHDGLEQYFKLTWKNFDTCKPCE